jgi:drug/metabolite transporter (DMT)-like permease
MKPGLFWNPYLQLIACVLTGTASEVCLKIGADQTAHIETALPWLGLSGLASQWVWIGIIFTIMGLFSWMLALRAIPLGVAFTLSSLVHVLVPLSCWAFLGESLPPQRIAGIGLVIAGLLIIAKSPAKADARI